MTNRMTPRYFNLAAITLDGHTYSTQLWATTPDEGYVMFSRVVRDQYEWKKFLVATLTDMETRKVTLYDAAALQAIRDGAGYPEGL